jgi:Ca-activated chloride channel homolog
MLEQADERAADRGRLVFYFGDGEQTAAGPPAPFTIDKRLIGGGAVLGYGTTQGGRMKATRARFDASAGYIVDPTTGEDARSVIDEANLRGIGQQLGLPYVHREAGDSIDPVVGGIDLERFGTSEEVEQQRVRARQELYWLLLLGVAGLAVWEVGASLAALSQARRRKQGQP